MSQKIRATFTLDSSVIDDLKDLKEKTGVPRSYFVNTILRLVLDQTLKDDSVDDFQESLKPRLLDILLDGIDPEVRSKIDIEYLEKELSEELENFKVKKGLK